MKTKNFFLMAVMLLLSVSAFAQESDVYDYYLGTATEEQIQDQSYINGLTYNQSGVKPTELTLPAGYNVIIYPSSWGTPTITDDNGFGLAPYTANDLGITNPTGKIVIVEEMSANQTHINISWESSQPTYTYYLSRGEATEEQIQDQSYINSLAYNMSGEKPTQIDFKYLYNVLIIPQSWGIPTVADANGFTATPYQAADLGITDPSGKRVLVYESSNSTVYLTWNSDQLTYTYYLSRGEATEAQIQDQSYINSLAYNMSGEKPTQIDFKYQYNVLIIPQSWGIPTVKDPNGFSYTPYQAADLGITDPSGKRVLVYESSNITAYLTWESSGTTSISNTRILKEDGAYHSLKGQRVNNPSNGIYIQNGKKILVK